MHKNCISSTNIAKPMLAAISVSPHSTSCFRKKIAFTGFSDSATNATVTPDTALSAIID